MLTLDLACPIAWRTTTTATTTPGRLEQQALSSAAAFSPTTPTLTTRGKADVPKDYFGDVVETKKGDIVGSSELLPKLDAGVEIEGDQGGEKGGEEGEEEGEEGVRWLTRRYHETLWLGEEHSPLTGFLHHLSRFERDERRRRVGVAARKGNRSINGKEKAESQVESSVSLQARSLLRNRRQIRKRYASAATAAEGEREAEEGTVVSSSSSNTKRDTFVQELARDHTHGRVHPCAEEMIRMAIESGPGRLVGDELSRLPNDKSDEPRKQGMGRMTKAWLQAIECRELQIQILLVLYLLQLSTRLPSSSSGASTTTTTTTTTPPKGSTFTSLTDRQDEARSPLQSIVEPNAPIDATPPSISTSTTKRKRKADHAQRWTGVGGSKGMMAAFPWTLQRQTGGREGQQQQQSSRFGGGGGGEEEEEDDCVSAETLSKRFESLLDSLSLQMLTCSIGLDANSIFSSPSSSKIIRVRERLQPWQLFGSEGRRRQRSSKEDKKDVLQWLCCSVIEPYFSKTLPRQCGIVRGKCFIPGSGTTPAKPARKEHHHIKVRSERDKEKEREKRKRDRDRDRQEEDKDRTRRSVSRGKSPSPAPTPWSLLRNQAADESKQPVSRSSAFLEKLDARTVNVRKKWVRSQSIGPLPSSSSTTTSTTFGGQGDSQSQRLQQPPSRSSTSIAGRGNSVQPDPRTATQRQNQSRPVLDPKTNRRESQTLVMATPSKASAYGSLPRSSSFSTANAVSFHPSSSSSSITSMNNNSWRRTESQPVLMRKGVGRGNSQMHDDDDDAWMMGDNDGDDDIAADEQIVDSLYFDESDEEEGEEEGDAAGDLPLVASPIQSKRAILEAVYNDNEKDDEDDDYGGEIVVAKKRRLLPNSFSFALLGGGGGGGETAASTQVSTTASNAPQQASSGRNPFAVSQSVDVL